MDTPDLGKRRLLDDSAAHSILRLCVHRLEMSLFLPFRNVTVAGFGRRAGAEPVRSARSPPAVRPLSEREPARLVEKLSRL